MKSIDPGVPLAHVLPRMAVRSMLVQGLDCEKAGAFDDCGVGVELLHDEARLV